MFNGAETDDKIKILAGVLKTTGNICAFTGAGISCPSGIPDFRSSSGVYAEREYGGYSPETILSHSFFERYPDKFYKFYREKMLYPNALPNMAHEFFAKLEAEGKNVTVVTQNIDGLHQKAGSSRVFELHGSVYRNRCSVCGAHCGIDAVLETVGVPKCQKDGGVIKPEVVLYEEPLDEVVIASALAAISATDVMLVVGTSLSVYPAAGFVGYFRGNSFIFINKAIGMAAHADISICGDAAEVLSRVRKEMHSR